MFCIYCGNEIPEGTVCPCRTQAASADTTAVNNARPDNTASYDSPVSRDTAPFQEFGYNNGSYNNSYNNGYNNYNKAAYNGNTSHAYYNEIVQLSPRHIAIKESLGSPLALITAILFSAGTLLTFFYNFYINIFSVLIIIAMWITYAGARRQHAPAKTGGLTIYSGILIAQIVLLSILYAIITVFLVISAFIPTQLNQLYADAVSYIYINYNLVVTPATINLSSAIFIILIVVWTCIFIFGIFYYATLRSSITSIRAEINNRPTRHKISVFPMVLLILSGVGSIAQNIFSLMTRNARSHLINSMFNSVFEAYEIDNISFTYHPGIMSYVGSILIAVSTIFSALIFLTLRSKLKNTD